MRANLRFLGLSLVISSAALIAGCAVSGDEDPASGAPIVVDDSVDPAAGDVSVKLSVDKASIAANESVVVNVTLTNVSDHPVRLLSFYAPSEELEEDLFQVSRDGSAVDFIGPHYKRPAPTDEDFVMLAPGKSLVSDIDITSFYDLAQSGKYALRYSIDIMQPGVKEPVSLQSNEVGLFIEGHAQTAPQQIKGSGTNGLAFSKCDATQQTTITQALGAASTMANEANTYLAGTPSATPRYTTWFGAYSSSGWDTAKNHFVAIKDAFDTKPMSFDCGCKKKYYAYVYPNQPYNVYLCSVFWSAPLTGTDSKGGTIIHETSHFTAVAGTDDFVYGQSGAKSLAISDPSKALFNADTHEYFAENTPFLQ